MATSPTDHGAPDHATDDVRQALPPIASLLSKSEQAQQKVAPGTWQHTMLRDNVRALQIASALMKGDTRATSRLTKNDLRGGLQALASMIRKTERAQAIPSLGKSQRTLLQNRLKSLRRAAGFVEASLIR